MEIREKAPGSAPLPDRNPLEARDGPNRKYLINMLLNKNKLTKS